MISQHEGLGKHPSRHVSLKRSLGLTLTVLYGLGITIGAGIYVLVGVAGSRAGMHAPLAFIVAALVMVPSAASFAELASRLPKSAGEAAYVREGWRSDWLAFVVGLMVIAIAIISAAAVSRGSAGYIRELLDLPLEVIVIMVVLAMGLVAAWGIVESATVGGFMTLIELAGLVVIIGIGAVTLPDVATRVPEMWPHGIAAWAGVLGTAMIAFFAFTGFEGLANIAEEVKEPARTIPRAIMITLVLTTLLYVLVAWIVLLTLTRQELETSRAPLTLVFERLTGTSPVAFNAVAVVATVNGVIFYMVMASRVAYGLACQGLLPVRLSKVNPITRTPLLATGIVVAVVFGLALIFPVAGLAEMTSRLTLLVFALVNTSLLLLKLRAVAAPPGGFVAPIWMPAAGAVSSLGLLVAEMLVLAS